MFPFKFLKSQSNLDSIVYQKKRIQFEIKELDRKNLSDEIKLLKLDSLQKLVAI